MHWLRGRGGHHSHQQHRYGLGADRRHDHPFTANFDGNAPSYTISGLFINRTTDNIGLFGVTGNERPIRNVKLTRVNVTGDNAVGALVGRNETPIDNCEVTGTGDRSLDGWRSCWPQ